MRLLMNTNRILLALLALALPAGATDYTWDGGGADSNWATADNWNANGVPVDGDTLTWDGSGGSNVKYANANNLPADTDIAGLSFINAIGGHTLSGNRIELTGNISNTTSNITGVQTLNFDILLSGATRTFTASPSVTLTAGNTYALSFNGEISGDQGLILTGNTNGKILLAGANTYTGDTLIGNGTANSSTTSTGTTGSAGFVIVGHNQAFGTGKISASGTQLWAQSSGINLANDMDVVAGGLRFGGANSMTLSGPVTLVGADRSVGVYGAGTLTVSGAIGDDGGTRLLAKEGTGTLILTAANTYGGETRMFSGTLTLSGGNNRLPTGSTVNYTGASTLDLGATNQTVAGLSFGADVTGTLAGSGTLTLTGANVNLGGAGNTTLNATGLSNFTYNNPAGTLGLNVSTADRTANANLGGTVGITALAFNVGSGGPGGSGNGKSNTFALGQTNTIQADTINVGRGGANNGNSTLRFVSSQIAPTLTIRGTAGGTSRANILVGYADSNTDYSGETGTINLTTGVTDSVLDARVGTLTLGYHALGAGNFNNTTAGNFIFSLGTLDATTIKLATAGSPANKTSNGTLTVSGGTVKVQTLRMVEDNGGAAGTATVNINSGSTFFIQNVTTQASGTKIINWNDGTIRNYDASTDLNIASGVTINLLTAGTHTLEADTGRSITVGSVLTNTGALTKSGDGAVILTAANDYSGATAIRAGTLLVNGSLAGAGLVTVSAGATLGGGGSAGAVTVDDGGVLAPGQTTLIDNSFNLSSLALNSDSILMYDLAAPQPEDDFIPSSLSDHVALAGSLALDGKLRINALAGFEANAGARWMLMSYPSGGGQLTDGGLEIDLPNSTGLPAPPAGHIYTIDTATDGYVFLTVAVPEPGTGALVVLSLLLLRKRVRVGLK